MRIKCIDNTSNENVYTKPQAFGVEPIATYHFRMNSTAEGMKLYTVSRGEICNREKDRWEELKRLVEDEPMEEVCEFVKDLKDYGNYGGVSFTNTFKVNKPISLVSLGFFGPHNKSPALYDVRISLEVLKSGRTIASNRVKNVEGWKKEIFQVAFQQPVPILQNVFYIIRFQLDGPDTGICDSRTLQRECFGSDTDNWPSNASYFHFSNGSMQMPKMYFIIPNS